MSWEKEESDLKSQSRISFGSRPSTTVSRPSTEKSLITLSSLSYGNSDSEFSEQSFYADVPPRVEDAPLEEVSYIWTDQSSRRDAPLEEVSYIWTDQSSRRGHCDQTLQTLPPEDGVDGDRLWCCCFTCPKKRKNRRPIELESIPHFYTRRRQSTSDSPVSVS